jgi:hypothetical protein
LSAGAKKNRDLAIRAASFSVRLAIGAASSRASGVGPARPGREIMKRWIVFMCLALASLVIGCSKDDDVNAFVQKLDGFTNELVQRVESGDPKAGVSSALQYLEQNRAEIESAYKQIEGVRGFQVEEQTMSNLEASITRNTTKVMSLRVKHAGASVGDRELDQQLKKLTGDYQKMLPGGAS